MSGVILIGDARDRLAELPDGTFNTCVTSPPYFGLRDYGCEGQIGLETTPDEYVAELVAVFREVHRVLRDDGTLWLNIGDSYANDGKWGGSSGGKHASALHGDTSIGRTKVRTGLKPKDLIGIPWRVAFALQADGWYLRQDIIWHKPNAMPESVRDRCTKAHEYVFLFSKSPRYFFDHEAIKEAAIRSDKAAWVDRTPDKKRGHVRIQAGFGGRYAERIAEEGAPEKRNCRSVWSVATRPFKEAHFAVYPPALIEPCILAGSPEGGVVLDPFFGAGTTGLVAQQHGRSWIGVELNPDYAAIARKRLGMEITPDLETLAAWCLAV